MNVLTSRESADMVNGTVLNLAPDERPVFLTYFAAVVVQSYQRLLADLSTGAEKERLEIELGRLKARLDGIDLARRDRDPRPNLQ
jgi:hypothetical protein